MENPFAGLKQSSTAGATRYPMAWKSSDTRQKRDALYAKYTSQVFGVLDQLIAAYHLEVWVKGSDFDHEYCCHCRWYAGPEETSHAHYGDHAIRRRIEVELVTNDQCVPTGFKIWYHDNARCVQAGLSQDELVRGMKMVLA